MFGAKVTFGSGATIYGVETAFESRNIVLSMVSENFTVNDVRALFQTSTREVSEVTFDVESDSRVARVTLSKAISTSDLEKLLAENVTNQKISGRFLNHASIQASLRSTKVKISWYKPTRIAWAHYRGSNLARKQAKRLDGYKFDKIPLKVAAQEPFSPNASSYSVEIKGLPIRVRSEDLIKLFQAYSVTLGAHSYNAPTVLEEIKERVHDCGDYETFEILPRKEHGRKLTAFVQFKHPDGAAKAVSRLHMKPQSFLRYSSLMLQHIHSLRYDITQEQYRAIRSELESLAKSVATGCKLRFYDGVDSGPVCIRGYSVEPKALVSLKLNLEKILSGELLKFEDATVWDEGLFKEENIMALREIQENTKSWVKFDQRLRHIRLFGQQNDRRKLALEISRIIDRLAQRRHVIPIERGALRALFMGDFRRIETLIGEGKLDLDVVASAIVLNGTDDELAAVKNQLKLTSSVIVETNDEDNCPVCGMVARSPVMLSCNHVYCSDCLTHLLQSQSRDMEPRCACIYKTEGGTCRKPIGNELILILLSAEDQRKLFKAAFHSYIRRRPDEFLYCPTADCETIYRPTKSSSILQCTTCQAHICTFCRSLYHEGVSCGDYGAQVSQTAAWGDDLSIKKCPKCEIPLQKDGGCNHLECLMCRVHICWICLAIFERDNFSVYVHIRESHSAIVM